jgi:hypothetical protein
LTGRQVDAAGLRDNLAGLLFGPSLRGTDLAQGHDMLFSVVPEAVPMALWAFEKAPVSAIFAIFFRRFSPGFSVEPHWTVRSALHFRVNLIPTHAVAMTLRRHGPLKSLSVGEMAD